MLGVCCPEYLPCNTSPAAGPPPPPCTSPEMYIALVVAAPVALIFLLLRNLHRPLLAQLPDGVPDQIPATPQDLDAPTVSSSTTPPQAESEASGSRRASDEEAVGVGVGVGVEDAFAVGFEEAVAVGVEEALAVAVEEAVAVGFEEAVAVGVEEAVAVGFEEDVGVAVGIEEDVGVGVGDEASRAELAPTFINATVDRSSDVPCIRNKILEAFGGIHLDIHSSDESTIHPATGVLKQSIGIFCENTDRVQSIFGTGDCTLEAYFLMFDCWVFKLKEDAERIFQGEKGRMCIFVLNNTYYVWQMVCYPGVPFSNVELTSRIISMIHRYRKSYLDECWVPLTNTCRLGKFTSVFHTICERQMAWKVTAELRYTLRQEIADLILPSYELSLLAFKANQSPLSKILYWLKRSMAGQKKQRMLTVDALEKVIKELFEG